MNIHEINQMDDMRLSGVPHEESDQFEFKSSKIPMDHLKNKISIAASAFWNSGGGIFIAGVNDNGQIDGGLPSKIGKQSLRDWVDNALKFTEPTGDYDVKLIPINDGNESIEKVLLLISFLQSHMVPHMAYDKKYYIRVGAHSDAASHFLVEALRTMRHNTRPLIKGIMKYHSTKPTVELLSIVALNSAPALNVTIMFDPLPILFQHDEVDEFPLELALIDQNNPFDMEISLFGSRDQSFGKDPVRLLLTYKDVLGNTYEEQQFISPHKNLPPVSIGKDVFSKLVNSIDKLTARINSK